MSLPEQSQTLYQQIADKLETLIRSGTLRPGERLPSVRRACGQHGVSLTTIVQAYQSLEDRGLGEARAKTGFFVRSQLREQVLEPLTSSPKRSATQVNIGSLQSRIFTAARMTDVVPLGAGYPGLANLPVAKLSRIMASMARREGGISYEMPPGSEKLRREIAKRGLDRRLNLSPDDIITTSGGAEGGCPIDR